MSDKIYNSSEQSATSVELGPVEYMVKCLQGPWTVEHEQVRPFYIKIKAGAATVLNMSRYAYGTMQRTLMNCLGAVGFRHSEQDDIRECLRLQIQLANLIASSPELLSALKLYVSNDDIEDYPCNEYGLEIKRKALAEITKAESKLIPS